jgi:hypothetical protein
VTARTCMLHPENVCNPDADGKCTCAPVGMSHDARCATHRGHKCNCMIAVVGDEAALSIALSLALSRHSGYTQP